MSKNSEEEKPDENGVHFSSESSTMSEDKFWLLDDYGCDQLKQCIRTIRKLFHFAHSGQELIALGEAIDALERICNDETINVDVGIGLYSVSEENWDDETEELRMGIDINKMGFEITGDTEYDNWGGLTWSQTNLFIAFDRDGWRTRETLGDGGYREEYSYDDALGEWCNKINCILAGSGPRMRLYTHRSHACQASHTD